MGLDKDRKINKWEGAIIKHLRVGASSACIHGSRQEVYAKRLGHVVKCEISQITDFSH